MYSDLFRIIIRRKQILKLKIPYEWGITIKMNSTNLFIYNWNVEVNYLINNLKFE